MHAQRLEATGNGPSGIKTRAFQRTFQKCSYLFPSSIPPHPYFSFLLFTALRLCYEKTIKWRHLGSEVLETVCSWDKPPSISWAWLLLGYCWKPTGSIIVLGTERWGAHTCLSWADITTGKWMGSTKRENPASQYEAGSICLGCLYILCYEIGIGLDLFYLPDTKASFKMQPRQRTALWSPHPALPDFQACCKSCNHLAMW